MISHGVNAGPRNYYLRPHLLGWCVNVALALATANVVLMYMTGGYRLTIGPLQVSVYHLQNPLILLSIVTAVKIYLTLKPHEMAASVTQTRGHAGDVPVVPDLQRLGV